MLWGNLSTILLYVMLGTWYERCYLLAVVFPLRDSLQGWVGGSSYCLVHLRSCLSLLIVLVRSLDCFLSVIAESDVFNMYSAVTFWVMLSMWVISEVLLTVFRGGCFEQRQAIAQVNETIGRTTHPPLQRVTKWKNNVQQIAPLTPRA